MRQLCKGEWSMFSNLKVALHQSLLPNKHCECSMSVYVNTWEILQVWVLSYIKIGSHFIGNEYRNATLCLFSGWNIDSLKCSYSPQCCLECGRLAVNRCVFLLYENITRQTVTFLHSSWGSSSGEHSRVLSAVCFRGTVSSATAWQCVLWDDRWEMRQRDACDLVFVFACTHLSFHCTCTFICLCLQACPQAWMHLHLYVSGRWL